MSSATPSFPSTKQANNYGRLCRLLVDVGWQVLRETFDRVRPPGCLHSVLADSQIHAQLKSLQKKRVLSTRQWRKLYPVIRSSVSSTTFDSTLLVVLLRNICGLIPPATGWSNCPLVTDTTLAADIARIQFYRNTVYTLASNASVEDAAFSSHWKEIKDTLVRLGGACYRDAIDDFENEIMDPECEGHYQELLKQWVEDDNSIEDKLEEDDRGKKQRKLQDSGESTVSFERRTGIDETETESLECPPQLSVKIPKKSDLPHKSTPWNIVELPIDILLITVEDDEFLSCFSYLEKPFKSYHRNIGSVYFGSIGNECRKKRKIGLMKCSKGSADPGSSLSVVKDAVRVLRPRAVFSVGACSGLNSEKTRLGDVVVSAKLITPSDKTPSGRDIAGSLIRHTCIAHGWKAPLEKPDQREVRVHCDGVVLSIQKSDSGWPYEEIIQRCPEATAVEVEGGGVFAAAHDLKTEWVVVKGIKDYADSSQSSSVEWGTFASVMAASFVANILSDAAIFEDWPHYNPEHCPTSLADEDLVKLTKKFEEEHKECVCVLPYRKECDQVEVCLYVYSGKSGILEYLKEVAEEVFAHKQVDVRCLDLYNKGSRVLKVKNLEYPSGKPGRLEGDEVDKISDIISKNLHVFSNYRNITAVQPCLKVTESKQTTESCITVYVLGKGHIPIGESEIPQSVGGYPVDVVDGFWYQTAGKPWEPREPKDAQKSFTHLRLGASIGVKGERYSGTLGAIVKYENNPDKLYLLTCNHVVNGGEQPQIIHPALNDYVNAALWNLRWYMQRLQKVAPGPRAGEIDDLLAVLGDLGDLDDLDDLDDFETRVEEKFGVVSDIEGQHIKLIMDETTNPDEIFEFTDKYKQPFRYYFPDDLRVREKRLEILLKEKLPLLNECKDKFEHCLKNPPRGVATFTKGIKSNVKLHPDDKRKYYVDAAVAELNPDEVEALRDRGTISLVGTEYFPNGKCTKTDDIKNARELCKSGRTTGFTATKDLPCKRDDVPVYLRNYLRVRDDADGLHDCLKLDQIQLSEVNKQEKPFSQSHEESQGGKLHEPDKEWHYNCLCIPSERDPFSDYGDSGAVIFEKCDGTSVELKCLSGFGVLFGVFETGYKSLALASPLEIVLKQLSQEDTCSFELVSDFC